MNRAPLAGLLPESAAGRRLVLVALVDSIGTGLFLAGSALFFVRVIGLRPGQIGLGLAIANVGALATTVPLGMLADRFGAKRALVAIHLWRAVWFGILCWAGSLPAFAVVATCIAIADRSVSPLTRAVTGSVVRPEDRTRTLALMRSVRNAGFSVGAALTAPLLAIGTVAAYRSVILADAVSFLFAAAMLAGLTPTGAAVAVRRTLFAVPHAVRDRGYLALTAIDGALTIHVTLLGVALPLWVTGHTGVPAAVIPALVLTNTVLAVLLQVPFARNGDSGPGGFRALRLAAFSLAACCLLLALSSGRSTGVALVLVVAATIAMTFGELWQAVSSWTLSYRFAPPDRQAEYLSVFNLGLTAQEIVGPPLVLGLVLVNGSSGWLVMGVLYLLLPLPAAALVAVLERRVGADPGTTLTEASA